MLYSSQERERYGCSMAKEGGPLGGSASRFLQHHGLKDLQCLDCRRVEQFRVLECSALCFRAVERGISLRVTGSVSRARLEVMGLQPDTQATAIGAVCLDDIGVNVCRYVSVLLFYSVDIGGVGGGCKKKLRNSAPRTSMKIIC